MDTAMAGWTIRKSTFLAWVMVVFDGSRWPFYRLKWTVNHRFFAFEETVEFFLIFFLWPKMTYSAAAPRSTDDFRSYSDPPENFWNMYERLIFVKSAKCDFGSHWLHTKSSKIVSCKFAVTKFMFQFIITHFPPNSFHNCGAFPLQTNL